MSNIDIFDAIRDNDLGAVNQYLTEGGDPNIQNEDGITPLCEAIYKGWGLIVMWLLKAGANLKPHDLGIAVFMRDIWIIRLLISKGLDINDRNINPPPLHIAIDKRDRNLVSELLKLGANPDIKDSYGYTPLHFASYWGMGFYEIVQLLLDAGADRNIRDKYGRTPLDIAKERKIQRGERWGHLDIANEYQYIINLLELERQ